MGIHYIEDSELQKIVDAIKFKNKMAEDETFNGADMAELIKERKLFKKMFSSETPVDGNYYEITAEDLEGITYLRSYSFYAARWLKKITLPDTVVDWSNNTFNSCTNLEEITLSSNLKTTTGTSGFANCYNLKKVNVENITNVGSGGFQKCYVLERLDFHNLTSITAGGFDNCSVLKTLIIRTDSVCKLSNINAFTNTPIAKGKGFVYVPDDLVESYKTAENWVTYASQIKPLSEL